MSRADLPMTTWPANNVRHGHARESTGRTPTYRAWDGMRDRCRNPNATHYAYYGGRGIRVCERWMDSFANFLADMGEAPVGTSIDRIDSNGHYEPGNCRWSTPKEQARNRSNNRPITFKGRTQTLAAWGEELGLSVQTLSWRIKRWGVERALVPGKQRFHKLTEAQRQEIRALRGKVTQVELAKRFGVAPSRICDVQRVAP